MVDVTAVGQFLMAVNTQQSMWVGIGDGTAESDPLIQAGTANRGSDSTYVRPVMWWEVFCTCPGGNVMQSLNNTVEGDTIYVRVSGSAASTNESFTITDETDHDSSTFTVNRMSQNYAGRVAEWIVERPTQASNGHMYQLARTEQGSTG